MKFCETDKCLSAFCYKSNLIIYQIMHLNILSGLVSNSIVLKRSLLFSSLIFIVIYDARVFYAYPHM